MEKAQKPSETIRTQSHQMAEMLTKLGYKQPSGKPVSPSHCKEVLTKLGGLPNWNTLLQAEKTAGIQASEDDPGLPALKAEECEKITVERDNGPDYKFRGVLVAQSASSPDRGNSYYSGAVGRWVVLKLYRTLAGKYVCQRVNMTQWEGEHDTYEACFCDRTGVEAFFGHGKLAKELYAEAEMDVSVTVD